ncbi:MAG: MFS transporter [Candidatus Hermodarchaeota archaeon]
MKSIKLISLFVATLASFLTPFMSSAINIALPSIASEFRADAILLSWVATAYLLSAAMFLVPFGKIADIKGRKRVFVVGLLIFTITSFLSIFSPILEILVIFRAFQGLGGAMIFGTSVAILTSIFPPEEKGKVLGINVAATYIGLSSGPFLGGLLTQYFGWRSIFLFTVLIGFGTIVLTLWQLKGEWAEAKEERFDIIGSVIYILMLVALLYGISSFEPTNYLIVLLLIGFALLCFVLFLIWESRIEFPVLEIKLFRYNRVFAFSNLVALLHYSATFAISFLLSLYLQYTKNLPPQDAGLILVAQPIMMALFSPLAGWLSDRIEPRIVVSVGMTITSLGLAFLSLIDELTPLILIILTLMFLGFGYALFSSPNTNAVMSSVEKKFFGIASATIGTMRLTGQVLSMALVMLIFSLFIGRIEITSEVSSLLVVSTKICFAIFSGLCFVAIFASLVRGNVKDKILVGNN